MKYQQRALRGIPRLARSGLIGEQQAAIPESRRIARVFTVKWLAQSLFTFIILMGITAGWLSGQGLATLSGTVTDPSGAIVPEVTVTVTNASTGVVSTTITNTTGFYRIAGLIPGEYTLTTEKAGFKKTIRPNIILEVAQSATVDLSLQLGQVNQEVTVSGTPPLLTTTNASIGQVIGRQQMTQLPLNDRNYLNLALLSPGTATYGTRSFFTSALTDYAGSITSGIAGEDSNSFSLDGSDIKSYLINGMYVPSIDAVQEFKIETSPYDVSLGTNPGAQIILVTRSGTNQIHGSLYEFVRNSGFDARNYFDNPDLPIPELRKNQFGGTAGGPIIKDKLFWFFDYEGFRQRVGETFFGTVPTPLMRQGIFTEVPQPIYDPLTTTPCATCASGSSRQALSNNTIPQGQMNAAALAFLNLYPAETTSGLVNGQFVGNNFAGSDVDKITKNQWDLRIDYSKGKDAIFGRYSQNTSGLSLATGTFATGALPGFGDDDVINTRDFTMRETHTFGPTTVAEGQVSFFRHYFNLLPKQLGNGLNSKLGIQGVSPNEPANIDVAGFSGLDSNPYDPELRAINQFSYVGRLTKVVGHHTWKFGAEYDRWQVMINAAPSFPQGEFFFDGEYTQDPNAATGVVTGFPFADFLLGYPVSALTQTGDSGGYMFRNNFRWWAGDDWRVNRHLTLNLGVRYEYDGPFSEKFNRFTNFDPSTGGLIIAGRNFVTPSAGVRPDTNNYAPRFGFAYTLPGHERTVIRGGYGYFYAVIQENATEITRTNPPFASFPVYNATSPYNSPPTASIENVFGANTAATPPAPIIGALDQNLQNGYLQQASLTVEHQFGQNGLAQIAYDWQKNTKFGAYRNLNASLVNGTFLRPYPQFGDVDYWTNVQYGNYDALEAKYQQQMTHGLGLLVSYTYSKSLDNITTGSAAGPPGAPGFLNPYCFSCDYGRSASDFRHRFVASSVYYLPTLANSKPAVKYTLGGWEVSGILSLQAGFPVTPAISFNNSESIGGGSRPNVILGCSNVPAGGRNPAMWFNPNCYQIPPRGQFGNAGKGIIDGPGMATFDFGLFKDFNISERYRLQFRSEFFNLGNHPNFADPNPYIDTPGAGSIGGTATAARQIQFALKLTF
jgi:Carboxypeptidase regulatory-like domain